MEEENNGQNVQTLHGSSQVSAILGDEDYNEIMREVGDLGDLNVIVQQEPLYENNEDNKNFILQYQGQVGEGGLNELQLKELNGQPIIENRQALEAQQYGGPHYYLPPAREPAIPTNKDYTGFFNFSVNISNSSQKSAWIYSDVLNKVFIQINNILPLDIKRSPTLEDQYLRAMVVYSAPGHIQEIVQRCNHHAAPEDPTNRDFPAHIWGHVLRCTNPNTDYMGCVERRDRFSVVTLLEQPAPGIDSVRVNYKFVCKNSCPSGMNRRPIDIVFTLESGDGKVLGRQKLGVRVCSCPKRDKDKEEAEQRNYSHSAPPQGKKRKSLIIPSSGKKMMNGSSSSADTTPYTLEVLGKDNAKYLMRMAYGLMVTQGTEKHRECAEKLLVKYKTL